MDFPSRAQTHIKERKAVNILESCLPEEWIVREMTERDYGADLYVEMIGKDHRVTGDLMILQVKGTEEVVFDGKNQFRFDGIKTSTYHYWCGLPVPVYLVVIDLKNRIPFWVNIKSEERKNGMKSKQATMSFVLEKDAALDNKMGLLIFKLNYIREKRWPDIEKAILDSLTLYNTLGPLYLYCHRKPENVRASSTVQYFLLRHYENFSIMQRYLGHKKPIDLPEWYQKHIDYIKHNEAEPEMTFYYKTILEMFYYFLSDYWELIRSAYILVTEKEKDYWQQKYPYIIGQYEFNPLIFDENDWFSRYYFDEYENETNDILMCFMEDLK